MKEKSFASDKWFIFQIKLEILKCKGPHLQEKFATTTPKITHLNPPYITGSTFLKLHSTAEVICWSNASVYVSTSWLFNGGSKFPPHAFGNSEATLYIQDMTRSEVGNYTCIISRDGVTANASVFISVIEANTPFGPPKITGNQPITNGNMVLDFHSTGSLECASERNDVTFAWQFNGSATLPPHARVTNESLIIENMNVTEVGKYTCIISKNGLASATSVWVSIKEEKAHIYSMMTSPSYHPRTDDELNIFCRVTGYPEPTILWNFKDPMGLYYMPPDTSYRRPDVLHIQHFQPSVHSGTWTCMARNSLGADQNSLEI
ncbi:hypothetical protein CHS0354_017353 [Potamilus streckersoni]|uniref:Ig-like domain-containing protein n=1 Tax=Potamilus streckersoni TaxID=2493646 RepID=A0AAE0T5A6_9BIVA|nr:hypothetical protein CHS0354_017353 [Potamilus streckersoni]